MNKELEKTAIQRLKAFEPDDGYYLCYSGGKDSDTIKILAELAGVKRENVHNLTTVDAPETVRYIQSQPDVRINPPKMSMWRLIEKYGMPPTRLMRYCCTELKEHGGEGKLKVTGVRWEESQRRKESADVVKIIGKPKTNQKYAEEIGADYRVTKQGGLVLNYDDDASRRMVEHCYRTSATMINPIVDWTTVNVWEFLRYYGCQSNPLYEITGCNRIGCIGCPLSGPKQMAADFLRYLKYKQNYIRAFDRMLVRRKEKGLETQWQNGEDVMAWWLCEDTTQTTIFDEIEEGVAT